MVVAGLQKLSMVDYPGRMCATLFVRGCNLRCPFCYNASLVLPERYAEPLDIQEVFAYLKKRRGILDAVCVSGGEPLLDRDTPELLRRLKELDYLVKLDTNGTIPDSLDALLLNGLVDYVAMDVKNAPYRYAETVGIKNFDIAPIKKSINILHSHHIPYEFRTTVSRTLHTADDIISIGRWLEGSPLYFLQLYSQSGDHIDDSVQPYTKLEAEALADSVKPFFGSVGLRGV